MIRAATGALALTAALIPWQSTDPTPRFPDRGGPYLGEKPPGQTPELFAPGLVSTGGFERDVAITPDGREIFFGLAGPSYLYTTVISTRPVDGRWSEPEVVPGLDDPRSLHPEPALSADGKTLYFLSTRPDPAAGGTAVKYVPKIGPFRLISRHIGGSQEGLDEQGHPWPLPSPYETTSRRRGVRARRVRQGGVRRGGLPGPSEGDDTRPRRRAPPITP